MINRPFYLFTLIVLGALLIGLSYYYSCNRKITVGEYSSLDRPARVHPDYTDIVIPPNIAPLNFLVREKGKMYRVKIHSEQGDNIDIYSRRPRIEIPIGRWRELLSLNRGRRLFFDIYVKDDTNRWSKFKTAANTIANAKIDRYLIYRKITICVKWKDMGIY